MRRRKLATGGRTVIYCGEWADMVGWLWTKAEHGGGWGGVEGMGVVWKHLRDNPAEVALQASTSPDASSSCSLLEGDLLSKCGVSLSPSPPPPRVSLPSWLNVSKAHTVDQEHIGPLGSLWEVVFLFFLSQSYTNFSNICLRHSLCLRAEAWVVLKFVRLSEQSRGFLVVSLRWEWPFDRQVLFWLEQVL